MLSQLPHEIRLRIFRVVFTPSNYYYPALFRVEDTAQGITYKFTSKRYEREYGGAVSCLNASVLGEGVAAAAAEAFYKSTIYFGVDAKALCSFLRSCPLSLAVAPGEYIARLCFYMDEDPNFIGDGKHGQALRKADWIDLDSSVGDDRTTRSGHRTQLMRQCWRAILNMPRLKHFEFRIMPSQGKISQNDIERWEIRDIIPTHIRLSSRDIFTFIYLRTWEEKKHIPGWIDSDHEEPDVDENGLYESSSTVADCVPYRWAKPTALMRALAEAALADDPWRRPFPEASEVHVIRNYDAFRKLFERFESDKNYKWTWEGKTKRSRKRGSGKNTIEAANQTKRSCRRLWSPA
ncbi:hypothetical protein BDR22DRAFT_888735 [Usnea florida]